MAKFTYFGSLLIALTLIVGSVYFSQSFLMSFAASSEAVNIARGIVALLMLGLMFTNPPRSAAFRAVLATASIAFVTWAINYALSGTIALADSILFTHAALSFAIAALEPSYSRTIEVEEHETEEGEVKVRRTKAMA